MEGAARLLTAAPVKRQQSRRGESQNQDSKDPSAKTRLGAADVASLFALEALLPGG